MRCLHCHYEGVASTTEICPRCGVYLPSLFRDILQEGTQLRSNTYEIKYALGRGSFGITYLATHHPLTYQIAIKEFFPQEYVTRNLITGEITVPINHQDTFQRGLRRFLKEGHLLVKINHPNVVRVQDLFEANNTAYIVMDLIQGKTLALELDTQPEKKLPIPRIEFLMEQLVSALTAVHDAGMYHLDLKPENILITPEDKLVLVDFGSAKPMMSHSINRTRFFTEAYAAPEIIVGGEVGRESDIFELGMLLYEMLTGVLPTPALKRLVEGDYWKPQKLDEPWRGLVLSALALKKEERPSTVKIWWEGKTKKTATARVPGSRKPDNPVAMTLRGTFVLPLLKEQGMQRQFGRGAIRQIFPIRQDLVVVISAGGATLLDLNSSETLWEIDCPTDTGCLSPDLKQLALIWQNEIYIWSLETGRVRWKLQGHFKQVRNVDFSPDGELLASGSEDQTVRIWDLNSGQTIYTLQEHNWHVTCVAFSPNGQFLASGSRDQTIRIWQVATGETVKQLVGHLDGIEILKYNANGQFLASGSRDQTIRIWDVSSGEVEYQLEGHYDWICAIAFHPQENLLASAAGVEDKIIRLWDLNLGTEIASLEGHWNGVCAIAFVPESVYICSGSYDHTLRLWNWHTGSEQGKWHKNTNWVYALTCSPDGRYLASGGNDCLIHLWDSVQNRRVGLWAGHNGFISSLAFSPDGKLLASGSWDQSLRIWAIPSGKLVREIRGHQDVVKSLAFSSHQRFLVSGSWDQTLRVWDLASPWFPLGGTRGGRILVGHTEEVECVAFSPDNHLIASGGGDHTVRIWEAASGQEIHCLQGHTWRILCLAFSPKENLLISAGRDRTILVWDVISGTQLRKLQGHTDSVNKVAFSPDGRFIVSGSNDATVRLWDAYSGELLEIWQGHTTGVKSVSFSGNGTFLASADNHGVVRLWRV